MAGKGVPGSLVGMEIQHARQAAGPGYVIQRAARSDSPRASDSSRSLREFLRTEEGSGLLLFLAAVLAFAWANSPLSESYRQL